MNNKSWLKCALGRAFRTLIQVGGSFLTVEGIGYAINPDIVNEFSMLFGMIVTAIAGIYSLITSLIKGMPETDNNIYIPEYNPETPIYNPENITIDPNTDNRM